MIKDFIEQSYENISFQEDEKFMDVLTKEIDDIKIHLRLNKHKKPEEDTMLALRYKALGKLLYTRFGIPYHIIHSDSMGYTIPLQTGLNSIIMPNQDKVTKYITDISNKVSTVTFDITKIKSDKTLTGKQIAMLHKHMADSYSEIRTTLGRFTANLKTVKITGLDPTNKKHIAVIAIGLHNHTVDGIKMSSRESASILLHEVSHTFSTLVYVYNTSSIFFTSALSLTDDLRTDKAYNILNKLIPHAGLKEGDNIKALALATKAIKIKSSVNPMSNFNSEIVADQFATRFGLGTELSRTLTTMPTGGRVFISREQLDMINLMAMITISALTVASTMPQPLTLFNAVYVTAYFISIVVVSLVTADWKFTQDTPHEETYNRIRRIKLDTIRLVRTAKLSQDAKMKLIRSASDIDNILRTLEKDRTTTQLFTNWIAGGSSVEGLIELTNRIEQLMENDLHITLAKLKGK